MIISLRNLRSIRECRGEDKCINDNALAGVRNVTWEAESVPKGVLRDKQRWCTEAGQRQLTNLGPSRS